MTRRADFNAEEWDTVVRAPALAAAQVITAERGGTLSEAASLARLYNDARERHDSEMIDELVASPPALDPTSTTPEALEARGDAALREAAEIVKRRAEPGETDEYREFVLKVASGVAGRDASGGQQAVLDKIRVAVGA